MIHIEWMPFNKIGAMSEVVERIAKKQTKIGLTKEHLLSELV